MIMNVSATEPSCGGQAANIDKDITADQSGSTQAGGLIAERNAGKQTRPRRFETPLEPKAAAVRRNKS